MQVRKQQLELDMEQQTGSKSGKEYVRAVYCHPAYLCTLIMQNAGLDDPTRSGKTRLHTGLWYHKAGTHPRLQDAEQGSPKFPLP